MKILDFRNVTSCGLVDMCECFGGTGCLLSQGIKLLSFLYDGGSTLLPKVSIYVQNYTASDLRRP
jgi:hypothetical protein